MNSRRSAGKRNEGLLEGLTGHYGELLAGWGVEAASGVNHGESQKLFKVVIVAIAVQQ
jgi:hypothetical protein